MVSGAYFALRGARARVPAVPGLPSVAAAAPLGPEEAARFAALARAGMAIGMGMGTVVGEEDEAAARSLVFRRWVMEGLLELLQGPRHFNALARALDPIGPQGLANKLKPLEAGRILERTEVAGPPRRTDYALTGPGRQVALAGYLLSAVHEQNVRALAGAPGALPPPLAGLAMPEPTELDAALDAYAAHADRFFQDRSQRTAAASAEETVVTARRFASLCVRRWHGDALVAMLLRGPQGFGGLRRLLGAADQPLAETLRNLQHERLAAKREDGRYEILPWGTAVIAFAAPVVALTWRASRGTGAPPTED